MNIHDMIKLPPLPYPQIPGNDYTASDMKDYSIAAIEPYTKRIAQLEAARFAYASEFPPDEDGHPDVGSIHENIRKLKAELEAARKHRGDLICNLWVNPETLEYEVDRCTHPLDELIPVHKAPDVKETSTVGEPVKHDLYKKGDKGAPEQILDRNGDVVLDCCKLCGKAEIELSEPCIAEPVKVEVRASVPSDVSTHMLKRIEEYSREMEGKKIDTYLGDFLLYCPQLEGEENNGVIIGYYSEPYKGWYTSETLEEVFPTHFMPLPEKPL